MPIVYDWNASAMDTHRLKDFLCIAEEGSITRAANALGIAQPALSHQISCSKKIWASPCFVEPAAGAIDR